jgi:hypothetical protein
MEEFRLAQHFVLLVYPFRYAPDMVHRSGRVRRLRDLRDRWVHWWTRLDDEALVCALDDTYFFLPYVRSLLFPETDNLPSGDARQQVPSARHWSGMPCDDLARQVPTDAVLRLTLRPDHLKPWRHLRLRFERGEDRFEAATTVDWVDVLLFPQCIGFLVLRIHMQEEAPSVSRLNEFLGHVRLVHPPRVDWTLAAWEWTQDGRSIRFQNRDLVDFLLQGLTMAETPRLRPNLSDFLEALARSPEARYTDTPDGQVYGQVFHLYVYACLDRTNPGVEEAPASGLWTSPSERILYELATVTPTDIPDYWPHPGYVAHLRQKHVIRLWANWQGMALHDNVVFLGLWRSPFTIGGLPHNVENDYFHLYLFALFQKVRLSMMFGELVRREAPLGQRLREARRLWDAFMEFQNHYWFTEVTRKPQGVEIYHRFQEGLGAVPLYEELQTEVRELRDHYERKFERQISSLLNFLTFVGLPAGLLVELFSNALIRQATWGQFLGTALLMYAVLGGLWLLWRSLRR